MLRQYQFLNDILWCYFIMLATKMSKREETIDDMERDVCYAGLCSTVQGGPLSPPVSLNPSHLQRPWIRHTPASFQPAVERALGSVMHVCPLLQAFSYPCFHSLFLSLSECQGYQQCLGQDGQTLFYSRQVFLYTLHI